MDNEGIRISDRKVEIRVKKNGRKEKVIIEKSAAQGLPQGWIKKLVITHRTSRKIRRDPFFLDPKTGYIFQSFKDALRYVETGDTGNYARKMKESDIEDGGSGHGKTVLLPPDDLSEKEEKTSIYARSSKRRNLSSSGEHPENCELNSSLCNVTSQVHMDMGTKENTKDPIENQCVGKRVTRSQAKANKNKEDSDLKRENSSSLNVKSEKGIVKSKLSNAGSQNTENESVMKKEEVEDSTKKRITKSKAKVKKNELKNSVIRRASKRLAGIEFEPTPELKTRAKAQRVVPPDVGTDSNCKQPVNPVGTGDLQKTDISLCKEVAKSYNEHSSPKPNAAATNNCLRVEMEVQIDKISKPVGRNVSGDKNMKTPLVISEAEVNPVFHLDGYKQKEETSAFFHHISATKCEKTTVRKRIGQSSLKAKRSSGKAIEISPLGSSNKGKLPCDNGNNIHRRDNIGSDSSKIASVGGACSKVMEKNSSSVSAFGTTLADMWKDPCIAFAIKTLTGESLHLPGSAAVSCDPQNNHTEQKGVAFSLETSRNANTDIGKGGYLSADIWKDPCIDFAIKTLTGAIPIGLEEPQEGRQSSCGQLVQQCSNKSVGNPEGQRFTQPFSKDE